MDTILGILKRLYDLALLLTRPNYSFGRSMPLTGATSSIGGVVTTQTTLLTGEIEIDIPPRWADAFTVKVYPDENLLQYQSFNATAEDINIALTVTSGDKSYETSAIPMRWDGSNFVSASLQTYRSRSIQYVGEAFNCQGNKVKITASLLVPGYAGSPTTLSIDAIISKGSPIVKRKSEFRAISISQDNFDIEIPRWAKAFNLTLYGGDQADDLSTLEVTMIDIQSTNSIFSGQDIQRLAEWATFDSLGAIQITSCKTKDIPIANHAMAMHVQSTIQGLPEILIIEWVLYE